MEMELHMEQICKLCRVTGTAKDMKEHCVEWQGLQRIWKNTDTPWSRNRVAKWLNAVTLLVQMMILSVSILLWVPRVDAFTKALWRLTSMHYAVSITLFVSDLVKDNVWIKNPVIVFQVELIKLCFFKKCFLCVFSALYYSVFHNEYSCEFMAKDARQYPVLWVS